MTSPTPSDADKAPVAPRAGTRLSVGSPSWMAAMEPHRAMLQARAKRMRTRCTVWLGVVAAGTAGAAVTATRGAGAGQARSLAAGAAGLTLLGLVMLGMRIDWGRIGAVMEGTLPPEALVGVRWRAVLEGVGALIFSAVPSVVFFGAVVTLRDAGDLDAVGVAGAWVAGAAFVAGLLSTWFLTPGVRPLRVPHDGGVSGGRAPGPADGQPVQHPPHPGNSQQHEGPEGAQQQPRGT